jgi:YHS domain-containing protein
MDAESLKSLTWLIVWGGAFYLMMRYGCGAHMMGGHKHGGHGDKAPGGDVKDPVCGMMVDPQNAVAAAVRGGSTYYFCSASCYDKFEQAPEQYIGAPTQGAQQDVGHHHG